MGGRHNNDCYRWNVMPMYFYPYNDSASVVILMGGWL